MLEYICHRLHSYWHYIDKGSVTRHAPHLTSLTKFQVGSLDANMFYDSKTIISRRENNGYRGRNENNIGSNNSMLTTSLRHNMSSHDHLL